MPTSLAALHARQFAAQFIGPTVAHPVGATSTETNGLGGSVPPLAVNARYGLLCLDTSFYLRQGGPGVVASETDEYVPRGRYRLLNTGTGANRIAVLTAEALSGTVYITRLDSIDGALRGNPTLQEQLAEQAVSGPSIQVGITAASVRSIALAHGGRYLLYSPAIDPSGALGQEGDACFVKQGGSSVVTNTAGADLGMLLPLGTGFTFNVEDADTDRIAVISATGGSGSSLWLTRIDAV